MLKLIHYILVLCLFLFLGCKKYSENKLWFKKPESVFKGGLITAYTINGVDKMSEIRKWYTDFPYNYYGTKIEDVFLLPFTYNKDESSISSDYGSGSIKFKSKGRYVEINFKPFNVDFGAQNLFIEHANWKILKLTKEGQLRIQSVINVKTYEIQFN